MEYRREIDGLRALAVVPVMLFHAGFQTFSGGFVGVDVFFVISGYLITSIILAEKQAGVFSILNFYERRARRILPALFFMMFVCLPFAWLWLLPEDMKSFSQSLVAVSGFASNILFFWTTNYFSTAAEFKPLLHTWSLAVEEHYYLLFPLFLILGWRWGKRWMIAVLAVIAIFNFGAAQWGSSKYPVFAFFLLPTRAWEILIGAFAAFYLFANNKSDKTVLEARAGELASMVGFSGSGSPRGARLSWSYELLSLWRRVASVQSNLLLSVSYYPKFDIKKIAQHRNIGAIEMNKQLEELSKKYPNVFYINQESLFNLDGTPSDLSRENIPYSFDGKHISIYGSKKAAYSFLKTGRYSEYVEKISGLQPIGGK